MVVAKFANTTQHGAIEGKTQTHEIDYFNHEIVTSVGYRVKSKRGVQFRKWANRILKDYLVKGYAVNERIRKEQIGELRQLVGMLGRTIQGQPLLSTDETNALFEVVTDYTVAQVRASRSGRCVGAVREYKTKKSLFLLPRRSLRSL